MERIMFGHGLMADTWRPPFCRLRPHFGPVISLAVGVSADFARIGVPY